MTQSRHLGTTLTVLTVAEGARFGVGKASDAFGASIPALCSNGLLSTALTVSASAGAAVTFSCVSD
jgi:hypothetical protein